MSTNSLYIPKRIKVGFQKRDGTYTGRLAYIIYWDDKGKLRKETSWDGWRDKEIEAEEYENVPTSGLVLNKDVKRYNSWSHFAGKRTMIRVWDPRGVEIEITTHNLIGVLMHSDCIKRQLMGDYVYAWDGTELVLLPTCSEEYQKATAFTSLQAGSVSAKDLVPGRAYRTKQQKDVVYLGRYPWYTWKAEGRDSYREPLTRKSQKRHIFTPVEKRPKPDDEYCYGWEQWIIKGDASFIGSQLTEQPVEDFAARIEAFQKETKSAQIVKWEVVPTEVSFETKKPDYAHYDVSLKQSVYYTLKDGVLTRWQLSRKTKSDYMDGKTVYTLLGYDLAENERLTIATQTTIPVYERHYGYRGYYSPVTPEPKVLTEAEVQSRGLGDLYVTLDNGRRIKVKDSSRLYSITSL